ncbi:MAG: NFACT family protein [Clostridium argentinense]|uniref:Rqc2 homolog RqcH n=1 Tax=Clostridium faecium TaxID=2762223 RepID=A0ABR8YQF0_9CLOT|nr:MULTISPECIES: NFACT RNA binding domain-containing protein [Clostridium]MBD8046487.1 NFACT family protein [Clostridium faecium]MBS5823207.1 NFACT family protein [Clostridium argentinense]MDU1349001.1 NFACT RNA binding domain-containing protein [Clostridium argentinense]
MALDGIYLHSILHELQTEFINGRIEKINQPEKDEVILTFKKDRKSKKLLISASSNYPRLQITNNLKENPLKAPMFCMVLRKYLNTAVLVDIKQIESDRIVVLDFESTDELGFNSRYSLIVEIMGRHSNISLVRQRDNIVMDSIKHITPDINTYRILYSGVEYKYPPASQKLNAFNFKKEDFIRKVKEKYSNKDFDKKFFTNIFTGVSAGLSSEIVYGLKKDNIEFDITNLEKIYEYILTFFNYVKTNNYTLGSYDKDGILKDFHCITFKELLNDGFNLRKYESPSKLIEDFYFEKDKSDRLNARSHDLQKIVNNNLDRVSKKLNILNETLEQCKDKQRLNLYGELLTANIYAIKKGDKSIDVLNYYSENNEYITIELDEHKTPSENVQNYFKKYNKLKKSEENAKIQIKLALEEQEYLQSVLSNIHNADNYTEIEDIKNELVETGYIAFKKSHKNKKNKVSKPMHFISSDNIDIYIGKNNIQNDYLTLKFANKNDIWLHTKNIPGSHVIIKNNGDIPENTILEAATLAALYSKAKNSSNVPVDYTEVKNVKKISGAKPGMVIYYTNKTIYVTPKQLNLKSME